jgi:hypothetical protein
VFVFFKAGVSQKIYHLCEDGSGEQREQREQGRQGEKEK